MKLVFDDKELERLREIYQDMERVRFFGDDCIGKEFSLNFRVTDPAIASYILPGLLYSRLIDDINLGIQVTSINLQPKDRHTLRAEIIEMLNREFTDLDFPVEPPKRASEIIPETE